MTHFVIISQLNGLAMDLEGGEQVAGTRVTTWPRSGADSQVWYDHLETGTIRNKLNDLCIDLKGDDLIVNVFEPGDPDQQWERLGNYIVNRVSMNEVLDISHSNMEKGATILKYYNTGEANQLWSFEFVAEEETKTEQPNEEPHEYFFIISELNGLAMDLKDGSADPGTGVVTWPKSDADSQLWYEDSDTGTIRNKLNGLCLDIEGSTLVVNEYRPGDEAQQWERRGNLIAKRNNSEEVVDIRDSIKEQGAELVAYQNTGGTNQHWLFQPQEASENEELEEHANVQPPTEEQMEEKSYEEQLSGRKSPKTEKQPLLPKEKEEEKKRLFGTPVRVAVVVISLACALVLLLSLCAVFYGDEFLRGKDRSKDRNISAAANASQASHQTLKGLRGYLSSIVGSGGGGVQKPPQEAGQQEAPAPDEQRARSVPPRPGKEGPALLEPTTASDEWSDWDRALDQAEREIPARVNAWEAEVTEHTDATTEVFQPEVTTSLPEFMSDIDLKQPENPSTRR